MTSATISKIAICTPGRFNKERGRRWVVRRRRCRYSRYLLYISLLSSLTLVLQFNCGTNVVYLPQFNCGKNGVH